MAGLDPKKMPRTQRAADVLLYTVPFLLLSTSLLHDLAGQKDHQVGLITLIVGRKTRTHSLSTIALAKQTSDPTLTQHCPMAHSCAFSLVVFQAE